MIKKKGDYFYDYFRKRLLEFVKPEITIPYKDLKCYINRVFKSGDNLSYTIIRDWVDNKIIIPTTSNRWKEFIITQD
jgi:hypothetical protein